MGVRGGVLFLLVLGVSWFSLEARTLTLGISNVRDDKVCTMCEKFTAEAITYLRENKTQTEIVEKLHLACSRMLSFKQQCMLLVDYYAPLFFLEVEKTDADDFCQKMDLCHEQLPNSCKMCQKAIEKVMDKLEDPDSQLEIIEALLKACNAEKKFSKKCKKLVFEYGPLIMINADQFLASRDLCTSFHLCNSSTDGTQKLSLLSSTEKILLVSES